MNEFEATPEKVRPILKYPGSKWFLAPWIISHFPTHTHYIEPPYELSTRSRKYYKYELAQSDHVELLEALTAHRGMIVLSGYAHALYDEMLADWMRVETPALTEHGNVRREVLWINPLAASRLENRQISLFGEEVS